MVGDTPVKGVPHHRNESKLVSRMHSADYALRNVKYTTPGDEAI